MLSRQVPGAPQLGSPAALSPRSAYSHQTRQQVSSTGAAAAQDRTREHVPRDEGQAGGGERGTGTLRLGLAGRGDAFREDSRSIPDWQPRTRHDLPRAGTTGSPRCRRRKHAQRRHRATWKTLPSGVPHLSPVLGRSLKKGTQSPCVPLRPSRLPPIPVLGGGCVTAPRRLLCACSSASLWEQLVPHQQQGCPPARRAASSCCPGSRSTPVPLHPASQGSCVHSHGRCKHRATNIFKT